MTQGTSTAIELIVVYNINFVQNGYIIRKPPEIASCLSHFPSLRPPHVNNKEETASSSVIMYISIWQSTFLCTFSRWLSYRSQQTFTTVRVLFPQWCGSGLLSSGIWSRRHWVNLFRRLQGPRDPRKGLFSTDSALNTWTLIKTFLIIYIPCVMETIQPYIIHRSDIDDTAYPRVISC